MMMTDEMEASGVERSMERRTRSTKRLGQNDVDTCLMCKLYNRHVSRFSQPPSCGLLTVHGNTNEKQPQSMLIWRSTNTCHLLTATCDHFSPSPQTRNNSSLTPSHHCPLFTLRNRHFFRLRKLWKTRSVRGRFGILRKWSERRVNCRQAFGWTNLTTTTFLRSSYFFPPF